MVCLFDLIKFDLIFNHDAIKTNAKIPYLTQTGKHLIIADLVRRDTDFLGYFVSCTDQVLEQLSL